MSLKKLKFVDEVLAPSWAIKIKYEGPTPSAAIDIIKEIAKRRFRVSSKFWFEDKFLFVDIGDTYTLDATWSAKNKLDRYTKYNFKLQFEMNEGKKTKSGSFMLAIKPSIETSFSYGNFLQRLFYRIFMKMFYYEQRRKYIEDLKQWVQDFKTDLLDAFGTNAHEILEGV